MIVSESPRFCSRSFGCERNNAESFPFRLRQQHHIDDLSHSCGVWASATSSTVDQPANSACAPSLADHIGLFAQRTSEVGLSSQSAHRESPVHQHSQSFPHQNTLVAFPTDDAKLLSTPFTSFNHRPVPLNKTYAALPCVVCTQQLVSNVYCAFQSIP